MPQSADEQEQYSESESFGNSLEETHGAFGLSMKANKRKSNNNDQGPVKRTKFEGSST